MPASTHSELKKKFFKSRADNVSIIFNFIQEIPADAQPVVICGDVCHIQYNKLGTISGVPLYI